MLDGADRTLVSDNLFAGHDLTGITLVDFCLGEPEACMHPLDIDPSPDMNRIVGNRFEGNKTDVIYIPGNGQGNCFAHNRPKRCAAAALPLSDEGAPLRDVGTHTPPDADPITLHGRLCLGDADCPSGETCVVSAGCTTRSAGDRNAVSRSDAPRSASRHFATGARPAAGRYGVPIGHGRASPARRRRRK